MVEALVMNGGDRRRVTLAALLFAATLALVLALGSGTARADESATVTNDGTASADTGGNVAVGNASDNTATNDQEATADSSGGGDAVAANTGGASNESDGTAVVESGDANAAGTVSETSVSQESSGSGTIDVSDQSATVDNSGSASADTGGNVAVGNASDNDASNTQSADASSGGLLGSGDAVAVNAGGASNSSDGTAIVDTGDANAVGVASATFVNQVDGSHGSLIDLSDQSATVTNTGSASASTGGNVAIGNLSDNHATNHQDAHAFGFGFLFGGDAVAVNFGGASNHSDGTAIIATGDANALGVGALTFVNQVDGSGGSLIDLSDLSVTVDNHGDADASTGGNVAIGNLSDNHATNHQDAHAFGFGFLFGGDAVAVNFGGASNHSDGFAAVLTGDANAAGVLAATWINQHS